MIKIRKAGPFHLWLFDCMADVLGLDYVLAIYLPWGLYIHPDYIESQVILKHEMAHVLQRQTDGLAYWWLTIWYLIHYGYWDSPYEIDARAKERL